MTRDLDAVGIFRDRRDAGRRLAARLKEEELGDVVVLGLPRGGIPVAAEVARALGAPLDVIVVRKLGAPADPEVAIGALGEGGVSVVDAPLVARLGVTDAQLRDIADAESAELRSRVNRLGRYRRRRSLTGRTALIVDDGIATGATMRAACRVARASGAHTVIAAAPVGSASAISGLTEADHVVCLVVSETFWAVGRYYLDFGQTSDAEVEALLAASAP